MKSLARDLLRGYLARCPISEGKGLLYRALAEALLPGEREVIASLAPGFRMVLDLTETTQREMFYFGTYERKESVLIRRILRPGDVFWDIGANLGYYTLLGAACVGPTGRAVAFEPFPAAWARLQRNVGLNTFPQVRLVNAAVSSGAGTGNLYFHRNVPDGIASLDIPNSHLLSVACRTLSLDGFVADGTERPPTVMKIDVEGSEKTVLDGAVGLLSGPTPPMFLLEMEDDQFARHGTSKLEIQAMLFRLRFAAYQLVGRRWVFCRDVGTARSRNVFWASPASELHRARLQAAGISRGHV
jgi:FkbM family methyltransferase